MYDEDFHEEESDSELRKSKTLNFNRNPPKGGHKKLRKFKDSKVIV
jgi:hypothetical protein